MFSLNIFYCLVLIRHLDSIKLPPYENLTLGVKAIKCNSQLEPLNSEKKLNFIKKFTVVVYSRISLRKVCYGLAYSEFKILTPAQCFLKPRTTELKDLDEFRVLPDITKATTGRIFGISYKVISVGTLVNIKYLTVLNLMDNDLAVAKLDKSLSNSGLTYPFPLYSEDLETRYKVGRILLDLECYTFGNLRKYDAKKNKIKKVKDGVFYVNIGRIEKCAQEYKINKMIGKRKIFPLSACGQVNYNVEGEPCFAVCISAGPSTSFIFCDRSSSFFLNDSGSPLICEDAVFGILSPTEYPFYYPNIYFLFNQELHFSKSSKILFKLFFLTLFHIF